MSFAFELLLHAIDEVESFLVENGQPNAEIIVAEKPPRRVRFAAKELQAYIERSAVGGLQLRRRRMRRGLRLTLLTYGMSHETQCRLELRCRAKYADCSKFSTSRIGKFKYEN